ncbi:tetratricopeptide repeat protein [Roseofilum casamattae]|uniref:Tetratricopeptide repeat protein n=1 Tax=Roseofilum casamattae BLCC-M143 TaxID=3022442 RepID=A0ABT7C1J5_9CYAN|nr:ATP-binding protein [Roseofilum casamattae]MDJ1185180.1 tetratricopeptide repeat protein [Roseofilum casamattae BLCC-M143]
MSAEPTSPNPPPSNPGNSIQNKTEELAVFVQWVAELIRNRNWFTLLLLAEAVLLLFFRPEGVIATALQEIWILSKSYANVFWCVATFIPIAAVAVAVETMPRSLPEQESEEAAREHRAIKGLRPFTREDAEIFRRLQREQDLKRCCEALESQSFRFGHLVGESGCGKTSFLQAGLVPLWQERGKRAVYVRFSNQNPLEAVQKAIIKQLQLTAPPPVVPEPRGLIGLLKYAMQEKQTPLVLLFDQFEQFFVRAKSAAERQPFRDALEVWYAREDLQGVKILFSVRADLCHHLYEIEEWLNYAPSPLEVSRLRCFQPQEAAKVLSVIAETEKLAFDRPFVERLMVEELGNRDDGLISPVDLQILASMLNRESVAELRGFNERTLQKLGGIEGLLRRYLENVIASKSTARQREILVKVLLALTDMERQVRGEVLTIAQLQQKLNKTAKPREVYNATIWLAGAEVRLLSPVEREGSQGYELAHERMIPALLQLSGQQLTEADKANRLLDKRVNEWLGSSRHSRYLFDIGELFLLRRQNAYLIWGGKQRDKRKLIGKSWQQLYRWMAVVILVGVLALGTWSGLEYTKAGQLWQMRRDIVWYSRGSDRQTETAAGALAANGHFRQALQLAEAIDSYDSKASAFTAIAEAYGKLEEPDKALALLEQALAAAEAIDNSDDKGDALTAIAKVYGNLEQTDKAIALLEQALDAAETIDNYRSKTDALSAIAKATEKLEEPDKALALLEQALAAAETIDDFVFQADAFMAFAAAYGNLEESDQVIALLEQVFAVTRTLDDSYESYVLSAIAATTGNLKESDKAVALLEQVLAAAETINDSRSKADALSAIAKATGKLEEPNKALALLKQTLTATETIDNSLFKTDAFIAIAAAYGNLEESDQVIALLEQVFAVTRTLDDSGSKAYALREIAATTGNLKESGKAIALLEQVLAVAKTLDDSGSKAYALREIAEAYRNFEQPDKAVILLEEALAAAETIDSSSSKADALRKIAEASGNLEQWRLALKATRKCRGNEDCRVESLEVVLRVHAEKYVTGNEMKEGE